MFSNQTTARYVKLQPDFRYLNKLYKSLVDATLINNT